MVRPLGTTAFSFDARGPATAAPAAYDYDRLNNIAFLVTFVLYVAFAALLFLILAICSCCCCCRRSRDDPSTVANSTPASQHDQLVDEIAITIYAKDHCTDDDGGGNNSESCAICLEDFAAGEELRVLPRCKHAFHTDCVDPWLLGRPKSTCPLCRDPVVVARPTSNGDLHRDSDDSTDDGFPTVDSLMNFYGLYGHDESFGIDDDSISVFFSEI